MPQSQTPFLAMSSETWEDICQDHGFEWVDSEAKGRNEFAGKVFSSLSHRRGYFLSLRPLALT